MKDPRRRPLSALERIDLNLRDLQERSHLLRFPLKSWTFRQGKHIRPGEYSYDGPWLSYVLGKTWGGEDVTAWFQTDFTIPESMSGREVVLRLYPGGEALLRINGVLAFGIDFNHRDYILPRSGASHETYHIELECYFRDAPDDAIRSDVKIIHRFEIAELVVIDPEINALQHDLQVVFDLAMALEEKRPDIFSRLLRSLQESVALLMPYERDAAVYRRSILAAKEALARSLSDHLPERPPATFYLVGNCHIDLWYLWPYRESVRKNLRTNLIALNMIERYPEYIFTQSQAKLYADMQTAAPDVFARVKEAVRAGRFEPIGDMWVESDGNIPCGEAMVRQILYGRRYFREQFGTRSTVCWMPDVFGVGGSLPQILAQSGYTLFYTNKNAIWHDTNDFPHQTFWWEGIDGSRILAHIPPTHFIGKMDPASLLIHWDEYRQKAENPHVMYTYGFGDGGGGPTDMMLEQAKRLDTLDGMPHLKMSSAEAFGKKLLERTKDLPVWPDELYLEMLRGAQTSKGRLKRLNRKAEGLIRSGEMLSSLMEVRKKGVARVSDLEACWKNLLECHFHDAVTGTHCTEAGDEIEKRYHDIVCRMEEIMQTSAKAISDKRSNSVDRITVFNLTGGASSGHLVWNSEKMATLYRNANAPFTTQRLSDGRLLTWIEGMPCLGHETLRISPCTEVAVPILSNKNQELRTPFVNIRMNNKGDIESLIDCRANREILASPANHFCLYEDKPGRYEAGEISSDYPLRPIDAIRLIDIQPGECGPVMASLMVNWQIGEASRIQQEIKAYAHSPRIDFHTIIDWQEERKLLRVEFPLAVHAAFATYEIAFGTIRRSCRPVNSLDKAKFEVPVHRWLDISEHGYGVAILNNGKYGACVRDNVASLSLLKAPRYPDTTSDLGRHEFTYSLYPHAGNWQNTGIFEQGMLLNAPLWAMPIAAETVRQEYFLVSRPGVCIESFKKAEDGDGWILRLVDYFGQRGQTNVTLPLQAKEIIPCSVIEEPQSGTVQKMAGNFSFEVRPFGIHSFRIRFDL